MKNFNNIAICFMVLVVLVGEAKQTKAVDCDATKLAPCLPAFQDGSAPTSSCCKNLKEQEPCLCQFAKDPNYKKYVDSPNSKKIAAACKVTGSC
ncbi:hypothetical protein LIER_28903 [Lithospermum erythrorhizon]|uniref:Bifunctional inhibitor/plant lipid transfer protein/seed storage helical domain-containing protein n=1 Tax=Lithospermum erythrorhizon TaxID=34254 RepID=A0AAV3RHR2_LITER